MKPQTAVKKPPITLALAPQKVLQTLRHGRVMISTNDNAAMFIRRGDPVVTAPLRLKNVVYNFTVTPGQLRGSKRIGHIHIEDSESEVSVFGTKDELKREIAKENKFLEERVARNKLLMRVIDKL